MKKGFLLTKPALKIASTSSTTKVSLISALKSIPSNCFHDVIVDFISGLIKRNSNTIFSSIITTDSLTIDEFLCTYKDQVVSMEKLSQYIHKDLSLEYASKQSPDMKDLGDPMHQSDALINFDVFDANLIGLLDDKLVATLSRITAPIPVMPLTESQKRSAKKKAYQEQAQLLDLVVYDILAKWDNYTLLANLGRWGKVISVSTRMHKKYLSARVRLILDHECLKCYNRGDWTVNLGGIPVRWFPASWNLSERK
ncbi:hypothetical protein RclHR1_16500004 [Rhizophagus clarus]|uniref:Uncharacterized protein n=1 Tax=Rhizophagus clarus TaxID=94130 RepID=A0A2Z6QV52_9GLOM|nr:hypothetical protein RclHR1_16500004 [Rhizophagus clarus]